MKENYLKFKTETFGFNTKKTNLTAILFLLFGLFGMTNAFAQVTETFTATGAGTWTAPCGVTSITVEAWGAGGSGGGTTANNSEGGGGGAGGTFVSSTITVVPGTTYNLFVAPQTNGANSAGVKGQGSWFINNTTLFAEGGNGGAAPNNGTVAGGTGSIALSIGTTRIPGTDGADGTLTVGGAGGAGGNSGGAGGNQRTTGGNGNAGTPPGGGGGGAFVNNNTNRSGGTGAQGEVRITYFVTLPASPGNPTSNSPQCNPPGVTLTRVGVPPAGVTWYWQTVSGGTSTANSGATFLATASGTYYLRAQDNVTGCWSTGEGSLAVTVNTTPTITANPLNFTTNTGGAASFSVVANNGPTSYTWEVSTDGGTNWTTVTNGGVYSNATTATLNITGATAGMNGYLYRASASNTCGSSAFSTSALLTVSNVVLVSGLGTNNVICGENSILRDHAGTGNYANNRDDWSAINVTSAAVVTLTGTYDTENGFDGIILYDGVGIGGTVLAVYTGVGTINYTGNPGQTITVRFTSDVSNTRPGFEINVSFTGDCNVPCVAPTALPTALTLTATGTVISGSFTHAVPQPDNYLVVISTSPIAPTPANGTSYAIGATVGAGYTVIANGPGNAFSATGLANSTTYYVYVFSFNSLCIGGPLYLGNLNGSVTTTASDPYCIPTSTVSTRYIEDISTVGYITDLNNMGTGRSISGYADYTAAPPVTQIPGGGVTIDYFLRVSRQFVKIWVDWNNDGTFTDAAPELVYTSGGFQTIAGAGGFVVPPATLPGNYRIRIRTFETSQTFGPCGNLATGETEDYRLIVVADCPAKPNAIYDGERCDVGTVVLGVEGTPGVTEFRFYDSLYGGTLIGTEAAVPGITNWTTPALTNTTTYYVTAFNGSCESWYREEITAKINPVANIVVTPSVPDVCGENNVVQISAGGDFVIDFLVNEDFEGGGFGVLNRVNVAANVDTQWTNRVSPYVPTGAVWKPAITSRAIGNRFVVANSDFVLNPKDTQIRTANLDATAYSDLFLSFRHYFSYYPGEPVQFADVDISTDGGTGWTTIAQYTSNQGFAGQFVNEIIDLSAYAGQPQVMVRFRFHLGGGSAIGDGWSLDDIQIYGTRPLNTTFTWTGGTVDAFIDAACTIPYVAQSVTTVFVRPTALQLASPSWSFTANATLGNGCPISEFITITNSTKLWIGGVSDDWYDPNNWEPTGVPDINTCIFVYNGTFDAEINNVANDAFGRTLTVRPGGILQIQPGNNLTINETVTVDAGGTFDIESSGSLIQNLDVANTGTITMRRNATLKALDYVYWSSPVASFASSAISPATPAGLIWKWEPTIANGGTYSGDFGNWVNGSEAMTLGRGYIVRSPNGWPAAPSVFTASFVGVPNNGTITRPITRSTYTGPDYVGPTATPVTANDDNWNLLGNPYPSAISADAFLTTNAAHINGFLDLWTHGVSPAAIADPFYEDYLLNYDPNDYLRYNSLGGTQFGFDGYIGAGQGFFVLMNDAGGTSENVVFNNSMRSNAHRNDQFYRTSNTVTNSIERHRIWLKMVAPSGSSSDMLVGYVTGATNTLDSAFDAINRGVKSRFELYSLNENKGLSIQGRSLPFDTNDQIPLGIVVQQNGIHTIAISGVDGLFTDSNQNIYLEDLVLNVTHDLRAAPYTFTVSEGRYENRFVLRYTNETLGNDDFITNNSIKVYTNNTINVTASSNIKTVTVYDVLGRTLGTVSNVNNTDVSLNGITKTQSPLVVIVELENGTKTTQKVIF